MAMQKYQYETSPRKLEPEYKPSKPKVNKKTKNTAPKTQTPKKVKAKANTILKKDRKKIVISLIAIFAAIFTISYRNSLIDQSFRKNEEAKQGYLSIAKENDQMKVDIENNLNFANIEQSAKELLGMQTLSNKQTVYINLPKKDYIQPANESIIEEEEESIIDKIINKIKDLF